MLPSFEHWNVIAVPVKAAGICIASGIVPCSVNAVEVVPLDAIVTLSVNLRFLAKSKLLNFFLQLIQKSRFGT